MFNERTSNVTLDNCHSIGRKGACFIWADSSGIPHCLAGIQVTYKIIVMHHFLQQQIQFHKAPFVHCKSAKDS